MPIQRLSHHVFVMNICVVMKREGDVLGKCQCHCGALGYILVQIKCSFNGDLKPLLLVEMLF